MFSGDLIRLAATCQPVRRGGARGVEQAKKDGRISCRGRYERFVDQICDDTGHLKVIHLRVCRDGLRCLKREMEDFLASRVKDW